MYDKSVVNTGYKIKAVTMFTMFTMECVTDIISA